MCKIHVPCVHLIMQVCILKLKVSCYPECHHHLYNKNSIFSSVIQKKKDNTLHKLGSCQYVLYPKSPKEGLGHKNAGKTGYCFM